MSGEGDGGPDVMQGNQPSNKKQTIEKIYQKKSQLEHILLRPDIYIGTVERVTEKNMWIYNEEESTMVQKDISYVPGLYKIYDEILVNAADNKQRDSKMDCIKIDIEPEKNLISVWNNGKGIPVTMHKEENMFVPTMIFGHLLTSSNYNDEEEKVTGGRNGYGAKLCNIFSTKFVVETATKEYKKQFKQTWGSNMKKASDAKITEYGGVDFTRITFSPDLAKFKMETLEDDIVQLMKRRAFDVAATTRGVRVILNGKRLPIKNFKDYVELHTKNKEDYMGNPLKYIYENVNERWEVALTLSSSDYPQQVSFVNSIATTKGGRHVDYVTDMIVKQLLEVIKKKNKGGIAVQPQQVKNRMWIFINCLIVNPSFNTQTKEKMTTQIKSFGSKCELTDKFFSGCVKSGIVEAVLTWAKEKAQNKLEKMGGKKRGKLKGIPKLEDANDAGKKDALKCTLILTEGDSAKALAVAGLSVIGRDRYGVFPLRGKLLNVREATSKQIMENAEIKSLVEIIGLDYKQKYKSVDDLKRLRYGKVMIMTDQDQDGSHIKGLLINFIHHNWPELLRLNFLEEFITPIVKATKKREVLSFYSLPELEEWKANTPNHKTYSLKYYKGLGTSTSLEAREYFSDMDRHRILFKYSGTQDDEHILLAFSKKHVENRKEWLTNFMVESKRRKEIGLPERYLYTKNTKFVSYTDFVNLELVLFSNADNVRSIPSLVDGFKPSQRKIMFTCFKRNDKKEVKVAQLSGSVAYMSAYHHGETNIASTIVSLAQNFVGSNNINLLEPRGQFGTRLNGGKDSASPRYIHTKLSPIARLIFNPQDDPLLNYEYDDTQKVEPTWYMPIIPMLLVNGAEGIGTGWMTKIPNYNPRQLVANIRRMLNGEEPEQMLPYYKNFKGTIEACGMHRYVCSGEVSITMDYQLEITELPVGTWTQNYKENLLEVLLNGSEKQKPLISDYREYNTDTVVRFVVNPIDLNAIRKDGAHKVFKLQSLINTGSMCVFDELGCLRRFESVMDMLKDFYNLRMKYYQKRKDHFEGILEAEASKLSNQARFIMEKCEGKLTVENKKRKKIIEELIKKGYAPDPVLEWKSKRSSADDDVEEEQEQIEEDENENEEQEEKEEKPKNNKDGENSSDVKNFDYLLGMSMWMLTDERKRELLRQKDTKLSELATLKRKTPTLLWREDLDAFADKLDKLEEKERKDEMECGKATAKKTKGKKAVVVDSNPSDNAERIEPTVSEDLKKKVQAAIKLKEKGKKGVKKGSSSVEEQMDEFDDMLNDKRTLAERLGATEILSDKKGKNKKPKDNLKQTKLDFKPNKNKSSPDAAKKRANKKKNVSDDEDDAELTNLSSDEEVSFNTQPTFERDKPLRQTKKPTKYVESSDTDDEEVELFDNDAVRMESMRQEKLLDESDEDNNDLLKATSSKRKESSEELFDSLIGKTTKSAVTVSTPIRKYPAATKLVSSDSEYSPQKNVADGNSDIEVISDSPIVNVKAIDNDKKKGKAGGKKKVVNLIETDDDDDDDDVNDKEKASKAAKASPPGEKRKRAPKKKLIKDSSDEDYDEEKVSRKKKKTKKKRNDSEDSDSELDRMISAPVVKTGGRAAKKPTKYVFSDDEISD